VNIEEYRDYCLSLTGTTEGFPFDEKILVFKVCGKMFALTNVDEFKSINLKCDPEYAIELREKFHAVHAGYHMSKKHWNTINMDGSLSTQQIQEWITHSYDLVVKGLPKKVRMELITKK
jgi:predicted DNA-binding protein (MmcQ/YjbR family)